MIRLLGYFFGIGSVLALIVSGAVALYIHEISADLPDYQVLANYEPKVTTRLHAADGSLMAEYAKERRLFLPIQAIPKRLKDAYLAAEDKNFYSHPGIDLQGLARAAMVVAKGDGLQGGSTITQQVAKNFLLTREQSMERKVKEAILSLRIERAYSKDKILELYLNEIYLGLGSYGVAAASLAYFDKSVNELRSRRRPIWRRCRRRPRTTIPSAIPTAPWSGATGSSTRWPRTASSRARRRARRRPSRSA